MRRSTLARAAAAVAVLGTVLAGIAAASPSASGTGRTAPAPRDDTTSGLVLGPGVADGLPVEGAVYVLSRRPDLARAEAVATALGATGKARTYDDGYSTGWVVGSGGVVLRVIDTGGLPWHLGNAKGGNRVPHRRKVPRGTVTHEEALRAARPVLAAAGVTGEVSYADATDGTDVVVNPVHDGLPSLGHATVVTVAPGGRVVRATGYLAVPRLERRLPLLSPQEVVDRTNEAAADRRAPVAPETVVEARLGLLMMPRDDGRPRGDWVLAPTWLFTTDRQPREAGYHALSPGALTRP